MVTAYKLNYQILGHQIRRRIRHQILLENKIKFNIRFVLEIVGIGIVIGNS